ncbi:MAG: hypothetical protein P8178_08150 [Candidatus Thiodiazotropha sp.]
MSKKLSPQQLRERVPVWDVLAEFWLDTELTEFQFDHIARVIAASPYSISEAQEIHNFEVAPAVSANLASVAGEWAGFECKWLQKRCETFAAKRQSLWFRTSIFLRLPFFWLFTARYWRHVIPRVLSLRRKGSPVHE